MAQMNQEISGKIEGTSKLLKFLPQMQDDLAKAQSESGKFSEEETSYQRGIQESEGEIKKTTEAQTGANRELTSNQTRLSEVNENITLKNRKSGENSDKIGSLDGKITNNNAEIAELKKSLSASGSPEKFEAVAKGGEKDASGILPDAIKKRIAELEAENQKMIAEKTKIEEENKQIAGEIKMLEQQQKEITENISNIQNTIVQLTKKLETQQEEHDELITKKNIAAEQKQRADGEAQKFQESITEYQRDIYSREEQVHRSQKIREENMTYHQSEKMEANSFLDQTLDGGYGVFA